MSTKTLWAALAVAGLTLSGCGTVDDPNTSGTAATPSDESGTTDDPNTSGTPPNPTGADPDTGGSETGMVATTDDPMTTGVGFIEDPDGGGVSFECDIFAQDCPDGEKCMPWGNDGGSWNATRCSPISENPGQAGDECTVEGSGTSGIDDCDIGVMCWDVDPKTNIGTCVAMCTGDSANPLCEDPDTTCSIANNGAIVLCLPICDPLLQDCPAGQACYPVAEDWVCGPDASGEMGAYGDPCEFINVCDAGLICLDATATPNCVGASGCCTEVCDVTDPAGDAQCTGQPEGQTCQVWYEEGSAPPGYEDVGACSLPA